MKKDGGGINQGVQTIQNTTMPGQKRTSIFDAKVSFYRRHDHIANKAKYTDEYADGDTV